MTGRTDPLRLWIVGLALTILVIGSCKDESTKPPVEEPELDTTIPVLLQHMKEALVARDSTAYAVRFAPAFQFVFDPNDVGGDDNIPPSWGKDDEIAAVGQMFRAVPNHDGYAADSVRFTFHASAEQPSDDVIPGSTKVVLTAVNIAVDVRKTGTGEQLRYLVSGDQADVYVLKIGEEWRIARWVDRPISMKAPATEQTTWGRIKASWR